MYHQEGEDHANGQVTDSLCRGCGRPMLQPRTWDRRVELREGRVRLNEHGMCVTCYGRARAAGTLPDPALGEPAVRRPRSRPPLKVCVTVWVTVDPDKWAARYGGDSVAEIRESVKGHIRSSVQVAPGILGCAPDDEGMTNEGDVSQ